MWKIEEKEKHYSPPEAMRVTYVSQTMSANSLC